MKTVLMVGVASLFAFAAVESARAADIPARSIYKAPVAVAPASWTGCYLGGNVGWMRGADDLDLAPSGSFVTNHTADQLAVNSHSYSPHDSAVTGGIEVGCNRQWNNFVLGAEADFNWSGLDENAQASYGAIPTSDPFFTWAPHTETVSKSLHWFSTYRARAGFVVNGALLYATGGLALGHFTSAMDYLNTFGAHRVGSTETTRLGGVVGGGLEYALTNNWSVKAEYLYLDFRTFSYNAPNIGVPSGDAPGDSWSATIHAREHVFRTGLNYKFY